MNSFIATPPSPTSPGSLAGQRYIRALMQYDKPAIAAELLTEAAQGQDMNGVFRYCRLPFLRYCAL